MAFFSFFSRFFRRSRNRHASSGGGIIVSEPSSTISQQDKFDTSLSSRNNTMRKQLAEAEKLRKVIMDAAAKTNLAPAIICGIGSRESHWGLALKPRGYGGRGDFAKRRPRGNRSGLEPNDGGGYGRGLMQIDYDWHEFARTGNWQDARANIMYACTVLNNSRLFFERRQVPKDKMLRAILASYNAGATATYRCISGGKDIDCRTTGRDYSKDVLNRAGWFQLHGW